ncbi:hypothetical protein Slin15195_G043580 [Septoria linicola]|uniref:Uncharacterized protein n=1 Tax=Septoria linicola TaxID=215465 RepID=A0A9Q9AMV3_9PEZI|nr:hypothetical protein Slin14017_G047100 [Septoria linicola]USW51039.1 hypothetical protein Slin15195_G043580 [Septoria linicola]
MRLATIAAIAASVASTVADPQQTLPHSLPEEPVSSDSIISELARIQSKIDAAALKSKTADDSARPTITTISYDSTPKTLMGLLAHDHPEIGFRLWLSVLAGIRKDLKTSETEQHSHQNQTYDPELISIVAAALGHSTHAASTATSKVTPHAHPTKTEYSNTYGILATPTWTDDHVAPHVTNYVPIPKHTTYKHGSYATDRKTSSSKYHHASGPTTSRSNNSYATSSKTSHYHHSPKPTTLIKSRTYATSARTSRAVPTTTGYIEARDLYSSHRAHPIDMLPPHKGPGNMNHHTRSASTSKHAYTSPAKPVPVATTTEVKVVTLYPEDSTPIHVTFDGTKFPGIASPTAHRTSSSTDTKTSATATTHTSSSVDHNTSPRVLSPASDNSPAAVTETQTALPNPPVEPQPSPPPNFSGDKLDERAIPTAIHASFGTFDSASRLKPDVPRTVTSSHFPRFPLSVDGHYTFLERAAPTESDSALTETVIRTRTVHATGEKVATSTMSVEAEATEWIY